MIKENGHAKCNCYIDAIRALVYAGKISVRELKEVVRLNEMESDS